VTLAEHASSHWLAVYPLPLTRKLETQYLPVLFAV